jgi:hypothetical protein
MRLSISVTAETGANGDMVKADPFLMSGLAKQVITVGIEISLLLITDI